MSSDTWDPDQYERFEREPSAPFFDLLALVEACPGGLVVDLGCGTGALTRALHERTGARTTVALDSSEAMLERSAGHASGGLSSPLDSLDFAAGCSLTRGCSRPHPTRPSTFAS